MNDTAEPQGCVKCCGNRNGAFVAVIAGVSTAIFASTAKTRTDDSTSDKAVVNAAPAAAEAAEEVLVKPTLFASRTGFDPGAHGSMLAVAFDIQPGWHTYWQNAGDAGLPSNFEFTVDPPGAVTIGEPMWPTPKRHAEPGGLVEYTYEGRVLHLFEVKATDPKLKPGTPVKITCKASWFVCKEKCLKGEGECSMVWPCRTDSKPSEQKVEIDKWLLRIPEPWDKAAGRVSAKWEQGVLALTSPGAKGLAFFPFADDGDLIPANLGDGGASKSGGLRLKFDSADLKPGAKVRGVVVAGGLGERGGPGYGPADASFVLEIAVP